MMPNKGATTAPHMPHTPHTHLVGFDSLRFVSCVAIFVFHATPHLRWAYLTVDLFFALSSFLLTYLALHEIAQTGTFSRRQFIGRRALKIFPLYYWVVLFSFVIMPLVPAWQATQLPTKWYLYVLLLANYDYSNSIFALKFLWSIAVEEQFYWLFTLWGKWWQGYLWHFVAGILMAYVVYMSLALHYPLMVYAALPFRFANFAAGIAAAYLFYHAWFKWQPLAAVMVVSTVICQFVQHDFIFCLAVSAWLWAFLLLFVRYAPHLQHYRWFAITEQLGKYTYGLYVYSGFVITWGIKYLPYHDYRIAAPIELAVLLVVAVLSYHLFEVHFLRFKRYLRP